MQFSTSYSLIDSAFTMCMVVAMDSTESLQAIFGYVGYNGDHPWRFVNSADGTTNRWANQVGTGVARSYLDVTTSNYSVVCTWSGGANNAQPPMYLVSAPTVGRLNSGISVDGITSRVSVQAANNGIAFTGQFLIGGTGDGNLYARIQRIVAYNRVLSVNERYALETLMGQSINKTMNHPSNDTAIALSQWDVTGFATDYDGSQEPVTIEPEPVWDNVTSQYYVFYSVWTDDNLRNPAQGWINYATGTSIDKLTKFNGRAFESAPGWTSGFVTSPCIFRDVKSGLWYMYFVGSTGTDFQGGPSGIGYATAQTLTGPWNRSSSALLTPVEPWEITMPNDAPEQVLGDPFMLYNGTHYILHYSAYTTRAVSTDYMPVQQIGFAYSIYPDRGFVKYANNPTITAGPPEYTISYADSPYTYAQASDERSVSHLQILTYPGYYLGIMTAYGSGDWSQLGVTVLVNSTDMIHWTRHPMVLHGITNGGGRGRLVSTNGQLRLIVDDGSSNFITAAVQNNTMSACRVA